MSHAIRFGINRLSVTSIWDSVLNNHESYVDHVEDPKKKLVVMPKPNMMKTTIMVIRETKVNVDQKMAP